MSQQKHIMNASPSLSVFLGGKTSLRCSFMAKDRMSTMYCSGQSNIKEKNFNFAATTWNQNTAPLPQKNSVQPVTYLAQYQGFTCLEAQRVSCLRLLVKLNRSHVQITWHTIHYSSEYDASIIKHDSDNICFSLYLTTAPVRKWWLHDSRLIGLRMHMTGEAVIITWINGNG